MKYARFHEGPEGEKEWQSWFEDQPEEFQTDWNDNTEKYRDQFKAAGAQVASSRVALDTAARKMLVAALRQDRRVLSFLQAHARAGDRTASFFLSAATRLPETTQVRKASKVADEVGLYGFPAKTASFGLHLCAELLAQAGKKASALKKAGHDVSLYPALKKADQEVAEDIGEETPPLKNPDNDPAVEMFNQDEFTQVQEVAHDNLKSATLYEVFGKKAGKRAGVIVNAADEIDAQIKAARHFDAGADLSFPKLVAGKITWED